MTRPPGRSIHFLGLGAALAALVVSVTPDDASAQRTRDPRGKAPAKAAASGPPALNFVKGMQEAPAALAAAGVTCAVTEAAHLGASGERQVYEVACREGPGFIVLTAVQGATPAPAQAQDCVAARSAAQEDQAAGRPVGLQCRLPGNAQPARGLQSVARAAGAACTVTDARALGRMASTNAIRYEIACSEGVGYVLDRPEAAGGRPVVQTCFRAEQTSSGQLRCTLTTKAQNLTALAPLVAASQRACTLSDARLLGRNPTTQNEVLEVGCQGAPGFFIETAANGSFVQAVDCGRMGTTPCQFTAAAVVEQRNAQDYTRLLKAANFNCDVSQFSRQGSEVGTGREIVEVACSNRPDGAFALLSTGSGPSEVYDCLLAGKRKQQCRLTSEEALYPVLNASLAAQKKRCTVAMTRRMGGTPQGEEWYELACKEGRNWIADYRGNGRFQQVLSCEKGAEVLGGCKLPRQAAAAGASTRR